MEKVKLNTMCMILNENKNEVLVQERVKNWEGIAFPGGKVELGESIIKCVKREVLEETGLEVEDLEICGIKDYYDFKKEERYMVFLLKTTKYNGTLINETSEGKVYWVGLSELWNKKLSENFEQMLKVYTDKEINEMFYIDTKNTDEVVRWKLEFN